MGRAAAYRLAHLGAGPCLAGRRMDGRPQAGQRTRRALQRLRDPSRLVDAAAGRSDRFPQLSGDGEATRAVHAEDGLHPCRADADHRASVLRLMGLPDHRVFRAHRPLRHPGRLHVVRGPSAPARHRGDTGLGAFALPRRRARPGELRRHRALRAHGPEGRVPSGMAELHLQLRPQRGARVPHEQRAVLAGEVSYRRYPGGRGGLDALPRLRPQGRRMGARTNTAATRTWRRCRSCAT